MKISNGTVGLLAILGAIIGTLILNAISPHLTRDEAHASIRAIRPDWAHAEDMRKKGRTRLLERTESVR